MLPLRGLSVRFVHCAQMAEDIETISFAYDSPKSLPGRVKILLTSINQFSSKFCPKVNHPSWLERRRHSTANLPTVTMVPKKPPSLFRVVLSLASKTSLPPKWGHKCTSGPTSRRVLPLDEYNRIYRQGSCVICRMSL